MRIRNHNHNQHTPIPHATRLGDLVDEGGDLGLPEFAALLGELGLRHGGAVEGAVRVLHDARWGQLPVLVV